LTTILLIGLVATAVGFVLGQWTCRTLAELGYRTDEEQELPPPGPRHWIAWTSALAVGSIATWMASTNSWPLAPVLLPLTLAGPALAAIDLDVMRLPNNILGPVAVVTVAGLAFTIALDGRPDTALTGAAGGLIAGGAFWLLNLITRGGIGFGDVKLVAVIGVSVGAISLVAVWWAVLVGSLTALIWAKMTHRSGPFPYGPCLMLGGCVAVLTSAL
jgi:leader peptidase (prepilin peptidase)/N-methyltransferase